MKEIRLRILGDAAICVGGAKIGPNASHLFALLLLLTLAPPEGTSRGELQELLFGRTQDGKAASHRLRQLLYRLRQLGVVFREATGGTVQVLNPIVDPVTLATDRSSGALRALPHYHPQLPKPFLAWLESSRERVEHVAQAQIVRQLREAHSRQDWSTTSGLAELVLLTDPLNEEVATVGAESRAMLGQRDEALEIADRFVRELSDDDPAARAMRTLRARIARTAVAHREGALRGREECLAFLAEQWERATQGGGARLTLLVGPPGMGKTRVAEAFTEKIRLGGGRVVSYRCDRQASQHPLALFSTVLPELQALPGSLGVSPEHRVVLERLSHAGRAAGEEMPDLAAAEARRSELQRALLDLLEAVSAERPLLLAIDDVHLLDEASREVLMALAHSDNDGAVLVVGCMRPRIEGNLSLAQARRASSYLLPPLSEVDARRLLAELRRGQPASEAQTIWTLAQAEGNPFYLYALASMPAEHETLPAQLRSLASCAYLSLTPQARLVLESCLLLDTLATFARVGSASGADEVTLLGALRELEELDLVRFDGGRLRGPHAILDEALRRMIPGSVSALLHTRIAGTLAKECDAEGYSASLAWAAVQSWLEAGDARSAVELACRCARAAAALGEPQAGAELLNRIPRGGLPVEYQRRVLDDLFELAEAGNCQSLVVEALRERMEVAVRHGEDAEVRAVVRLRMIANALRNGGDQLVAIPDLSAILEDVALSTQTRVAAGTRLIIIADGQYDTSLAASSYTYLCDIRDTNVADDSYFRRAELIYHTTFGNPRIAVDLLASAREVSALRVDAPTAAYWHNSNMALIRLGQYAHAKALAVQMYDFMSANGMLMGAEFAVCSIIDAETFLGNWASADIWLRRWQDTAAMRTHHRGKVHPDYFHLALQLALHFGRFVEAEAILSSSRSEEFNATPRTRAILLANSLIFKYRRSDDIIPKAEVDELLGLYGRGKARGAQDDVAEALWCAATRAGHHDQASQLLRDYLTLYRREISAPAWNLRNTTASDPVWGSMPWAWDESGHLKSAEDITVH